MVQRESGGGREDRMPGPTDIELSRAIKRLMVRHWIDTTDLSIRTTRGRVLITGSLRKLSEGPGELSSAVIAQLFLEIRHLRGVTNVRARFTNWVEEAGSWREISERR